MSIVECRAFGLRESYTAGLAFEHLVARGSKAFLDDGGARVSLAVGSPDNPDSNLASLLNLLRSRRKFLDRAFIKVMVCGTSPNNGAFSLERVDEGLRDELHEVRNERNDFIHDLWMYRRRNDTDRMKTLLEKLKDIVMKLIDIFEDLIYEEIGVAIPEIFETLTRSVT